VIKQIQIILLIFILVTGCTGVVPDLGVENGQLKKCPATLNCVNSQSTDKRHSIDPIIVSSTIDEAKNDILKILNELMDCEINEIKDAYIRVEISSNIFRFVDDVEFYFQDMNTTETVIHVRSAARSGVFDFGVNRKRIERIRKKLNE